jgi:hypothetical protein
MTAKAKTAWALLALPLALSLAAGCANLEQAMAPGAISGLGSGATTKRLAEPEFPPVAASYAAESAHRTLDAPMQLHVPDRKVDVSVMRQNKLLGTTAIVGCFPGGAIVEREFGKVLEADFREPVGGEEPVAELAVRIHSAILTQESKTAPVEASLRMGVEVTRSEGGEKAFAATIEAAASAPWGDERQVPEAFYRALFDAISQFSGEWDRSGGPDAVARWGDEAGPGVAPPELLDIQWEPGSSKDKVQRGRCTVACNGFEGFRAKHWANAQIAVACRTKLGNIGRERLRVVYDSENYDARAGTWEFAFRCFARCERVLDFNPFTEMGTVIGDLELMKMDAENAAKVLKAYVLEEMRSHSGIVTNQDPQKKNAYVRFDGIRTDPTYNLIQIDFHLPR